MPENNFKEEIIMRINHNISALNTYSRLTSANADKGKSLEKLSSGLRINKAGDDAAGLAISEKMRSQIKGLNQASRNSQDGISLIQTSEGALNETHSILQRMRELAVQSSNDTNTAEDRGELQKEMNQLTSEISRIGNDTEFNTQKVLNGNLEGAGAGATGGNIDIAITAGADDGTMELNIGDETWTITNNETGGAAAATIDVTAKTMTINVLSSADNTEVATAITTALEAVKTGGSDNFSNFDFTNATAGSVSIAATDAGTYSGGSDMRDIVSVGTVAGGVVAAGVNATDGADGTGGAATFQIGANKAQSFTVDIGDMRSNNLGLSDATGGGSFTAAVAANELDTISGETNAKEYALDITDGTKATAAIETLDTAIGTVSSQRSKLGAFQNRLEHTINNLNTSSENLTAAESRVRDVDMAKEMMEFTKNNILSQASNAMMAQANQMPQSVLQLLQ